ncbi:actin maturation protease-like [Antedon mediterranea]|uniref:actin maturation protease-like n=1 Tax=Antedon mediterranea TaxID=105859 RepID=UPI003AF6FAA9
MNSPVPPPPPLYLANPKSTTNSKNISEEETPQPLSYDETGIDEVRVKVTCLPEWRSEQLSEETSTWLSVYTPVTAVLQNGPQCGIVALCMASQLLCPQVLTPDIVFDTAKLHKFTTYGEIFSVKTMCKLASILMDCEAIQLPDGLDDFETVFKHLDDGCPILVPYDKDESTAPCCRNGNKAHWAVVLGYLLPNVPPSLVSTLNQDKCFPNLYHKPKNVDLSSELTSHIQHNRSSVYVYAKQGKSKHLGVWSYQDLILSNNNLMEWQADKNEVNEKDMVLPDGGIKEGLSGQIVLLKQK